MTSHPSPTMHHLHISTFEGGNALSAFRVQQLLPRLQVIHDRITGIAARFVHLVASEQQPDAATRERLAALLTYGDPYTGPTEGELLLVSPRFGTVSPWASKATDIAHNCGLALKRVERVTEYVITLKQPLLGKAALSEEQRLAVAALLHDRMTESVMFERAQAAGLFTELQAQAMEYVDVLGGGRTALETANTQFEIGRASCRERVCLYV